MNEQQNVIPDLHPMLCGHMTCGHMLCGGAVASEQQNDQNDQEAPRAEDRAEQEESK